MLLVKTLETFIANIVHKMTQTKLYNLHRQSMIDFTSQDNIQTF